MIPEIPVVRDVLRPGWREGPGRADYFDRDWLVSEYSVKNRTYLGTYLR